MIRAALGTHDHPDAYLFLLIFRLMSTYSLVKPPKGSNVAGDELFETLIKDGEVRSENADKWRNLRDRIVERCVPREYSPSDGNVREEDLEILAFFAGYVAKKAVALKACTACTDSLTAAPMNAESHALIDYRNYFNVLLYPSTSLLDLTSKIEKIILAEVEAEVKDVCAETFLNIAQKIEDSPEPLPLVGCEEHSTEVTAYAIQFFLIMRMHFVADILTKKNEKLRKATDLKKTGKLIT